MRKIILITILAFAFNAKAQEKKLFKITYLPGHNYSANIIVGIGLDLNLSGDTTSLNKLKLQGITSPMGLYGAFKNDANIEIRPLLAGNKTPFIINYSTRLLFASLNSKSLPIPENIREKQESIYGKNNPDGSFAVDSLQGNAVKDTAVATVYAFTDRLLNIIKFPGRPIAPGDTFTMERAVTLPGFVNGASTTIIKYLFKFTGTTDTTATFDFTQNIEGSLGVKQIKLNVAGTGTGKLIYSLKDNYPRDYQSSIDLKVTGEINNANIDGMLRANVYVKYSVK